MLPKLEIEEKIIENPKDFFLALGGVHDADLNTFEWRMRNGKAIIEIDDLYSNFYQTPEYPGPLAARFIASELKNMEIDVISKNFNSIRILKFYINSTSDGNSMVVMNFGEGQIKFEFQTLAGMII